MGKKKKPTPAEIAKEEAAAQSVAFLFTVATAIVGVILVRAQHDPDFLRSARMRAAKTAERICAHLAVKAWTVAEKCRLAYEREKA